MKRALASIIVSIAMVSASVSTAAADTVSASSTNTTPAVQTGPLSPGGPVVVSPAQGTVGETLACGYDIDGLCAGPVVLVGMVAMGVLLAAIMGGFSKNKITSTAAATNTR